MNYNKSNPLKVATVCSGYDSMCLAFDRLKEAYPDFDYDLVLWSEFDPESTQPLEKQPAVIAHNALFPQWSDRNLGDMTKINWSSQPDFDLLFYSTPCQSISQAGLQHGFTEGSGTRSSIIWHIRDAVKAKKPKYLILENVRAMVSQKFIGVFNLWRNELDKLGYASFAQILDSKNYGIPQHRERIFLVSIRIDDEEPRFHFPVGFPLELCLLDMLEDNVDEKFFLNDDMLARFCERSLEVEENNEIDNDDEFDFNLQEDAECLRGWGSLYN